VTRRQHGTRHYPRTARLNELLREIVADELERVDDERLDLVTVIEVEVEPDLRHATVTFASLAGEEGDADVLEGLRDARVRLQAAIARQARTKRVPELAFRPDDVGRRAARLEEVLREIRPPDDDSACPA
jgi:ribosome-binding factor A